MSMATEHVTIVLTTEDAERIEAGLSDLLCWMAGFNAALSPSEDHDRRPYGVNAARDINIKIKSARSRGDNQGVSF